MSSSAFLNLGVAGAEFESIRGGLLALNPALRDGGTAVAVFDGHGMAGPAIGLTPPHPVLVDARCGGMAAFELPPAFDLVIRASTITAIETDLADMLITVLNTRFPSRLRHADMDIRCAVQEAIGNAVIHGNLGLDGSMRADMEGLRVFAAAMERRRADPARAGLPVTLCARNQGDDLIISVEDQGQGFAPPLQHASDPAPPMASGGLGLVIIHRCCSKVEFGQEGRRITMSFTIRA